MNTLTYSIFLLWYIKAVCVWLRVDINECDYGSKCDQTCVNQIGSYSCTCKPGFVLLSDNTSCKGIARSLSLLNYVCDDSQMIMSVKLTMVGAHNSVSTLLDFIVVLVMMVLS